MILVDEGTSNLDINTEQRVNDAIASLSLTRFVIAHRPDTIRSASRVLRIDQRGISELKLVEA
jgi:ATP-binding cassette subfamily B protein RaxB